MSIDPAGGGLTTQSYLNETLTGPGIFGSGGIPFGRIGVAAPGNAAFFVQLDGARANAAAGLGISLASATSAPPGIWLDLSPGRLIRPAGGYALGTQNYALSETRKVVIF